MRGRLVRLLTLVATGVAASGATGCAPPPPHLVLVVVDTLRADHVGAYGGPVPTPAMDRLARDGVVLLDAFTPTPSTGPAHASLMTGLHPWRHGVLLNAVPIGDGDPVLAELLRKAGYQTAAFVSSYNVEGKWGFDRGFDAFHFQPNRQAAKQEDFFNRGEETTRAALEWLAERDGAPFFLWVHYFDPHDPYDPPAPFRRPESETVDLEGKTLPPGIARFADLERRIRAYRGEVVYADAQIGRLVEALEALGLLEQTAVVVTSDHGEGLGDHGLLGHGWNLFHELIRIPLIVRAPELSRGRRLRGAAQLEDLMPTLLSLAGLTLPEGLDGVDLLPWLRGDSPHSPRETVVGRRAAFPDAPALFFTLDGPTKWVGPLGAAGAEFHLTLDPKERHPLAATGTPRGLRARLGDVKPPRKRVLDEESQRALEALGYL